MSGLTTQPAALPHTGTLNLPFGKRLWLTSGTMFAVMGIVIVFSLANGTQTHFLQ